MERLTENKLILVTRRTRLDDLSARFNTPSQARFYLEHLGADFSDYEKEHAIYHRAVAQTERVLGTLGRVHRLDRSFLPNFLFGPKDVVVALGQDGLVANTVKYLAGQPLLGVNPDPARWDGILLPFVVNDLKRVVPEVFRGGRSRKAVTLALASLNNGQELLAVNDLFIGPKSHTSARYEIAHGDKSETQSSSGLVVSTGLGSTGWFRSLLTGATKIVNGLSKAPVKLDPKSGFAWESDYLYFIVREPFPSKATDASIVLGRVTRDQPLVLRSQMAEGGVIFSDGIENDFLEFNSGGIATITLAPRRGQLVT